MTSPLREKSFKISPDEISHFIYRLALKKFFFFLLQFVQLFFNSEELCKSERIMSWKDVSMSSFALGKLGLFQHVS